MECKDKGFFRILTLYWREFPRFSPANPYTVASFRRISRNWLNINACFLV